MNKLEWGKKGIVKRQLESDITIIYIIYFILYII